MAETLAQLGTERAMVVHGQGLDELTLVGESRVVSLDGGVISEFGITPEDAGLSRAPLAAIIGGDAAHNAGRLRALLDGEPGPYRDAVLLNAAAGLIVAGRTEDIRTGAALAAGSIDTGAARASLERLRRASAATTPEPARSTIRPPTSCTKSAMTPAPKSPAARRSTISTTCAAVRRMPNRHAASPAP
jgi:anthranilate phosphoribosyltransferase